MSIFSAYVVVNQQSGKVPVKKVFLVRKSSLMTPEARLSIRTKIAALGILIEAYDIEVVDEERFLTHVKKLLPKRRG